MADNLTKKNRSKCMSNIRSKWTGPEIKLHNYLKGAQIKHKMHPALNGKPDVLLTEFKKVIFLNGCFWHNCPKCYVEPKSRTDYWVPKIKRNIERAKEVKALLRAQKYTVLTIWEHELKCNPASVIKKISRQI